MRQYNDKKGSGKFGAKDSKDYTSNKRMDRFGRPNRRDDDRGGRDRGGRDRRDRRDRGPIEMHKAVCDKCGIDCEVPFKPTAGKPVLCSDCFKKEGGGKKGGVDLSEIHEKLDKIMKSKVDLSEINEKLDKIMKALETKEAPKKVSKVKTF